LSAPGHELANGAECRPLHGPQRCLAGAVAGAGAAIAIGGMEWLATASHHPLVIVPFATSMCS